MLRARPARPSPARDWIPAARPSAPGIVAGADLYSGSVSDFPLSLPVVAHPLLAGHADVEGKLLRALEALGPMAGRDVVLVGGGPGRAGQLAELGARVTEAGDPRATGLPDASADAVVAFFSVFRGIDPAEQAEADRVLRPGGRLLVVHDYGRDDVSRLQDPGLPEYRAWSRRDGPFLRGGFRVRVVHCWWTFDSQPQAAEVLAAAFGDAGATLAATMTRPRLSWNVAVYHRDRNTTT